MFAADLEKLINDTTKHTEKECQPYLIKAANYLLPTPSLNTIAANREEPNRSGYADFIVSASYGSGSMEHRDVYVWEVKAPQCYLFEKDSSKQRLVPTKDLIRAETQLIYYVEELRSSSTFMSKYKLTALSQVKVGGIIIGNSNKLCKNIKDVNSEDLKHLEKVAINFRKKHIYDSANMKIFTWSDILDYYKLIESLPPHSGGIP